MQRARIAVFLDLRSDTIFFDNMSIVILRVCSSSAIGDRFLSVRKMSIQVPMYTFRAVVAIETVQWEGHIVLDLFGGR